MMGDLRRSDIFVFNLKLLIQLDLKLVRNVFVNPSCFSDINNIDYS
jgi:hypothetical protein